VNVTTRIPTIETRTTSAPRDRRAILTAPPPVSRPARGPDPRTSVVDTEDAAGEPVVQEPNDPAGTLAGWLGRTEAGGSVGSARWLPRRCEASAVGRWAVAAMVAAGRFGNVWAGRSIGAPASWNGRHARHVPAAWFQQLAQHVLEHSGQTWKALAPAEPSRSVSSPQRSQKVIASYTEYGSSSLVTHASAKP
jgi:hypothetical protein